MEEDYRKALELLTALKAELESKNQTEMEEIVKSIEAIQNLLPEAESVAWDYSASC